MLRELLFPLDTTYEQLQILLEDLDIPVLFQQPLSALLQQSGIIPSIVDDKHLIANLSETYAKPWFTVNGCQQVALSRLGVSPGDQLADLMYNISVEPMLDLMSLQKVQKNCMPEILSNHGTTPASAAALQCAPPDHKREVSGVSYVDGTLDMQYSMPHMSTYDNVCDMLSSAHHVLSARGVTMN